MNQLVEKLEEGVAQLGLECSPDEISKLLHFQHLLLKWNKVYNLTAITDPEKVIALHLLDSVAVLPYIDGKRILDVGTGAGLPGIPLAITCPDKDFSLLDSNSKKTRFVQQAVLELGLHNVTVFHDRVEQHSIDKPYDIVLARAFAPLSEILKKTKHMLAKTGKVLAMKGRYSEVELNQIPPGQVAVIIPLNVPGVEGERTLYSLATG